MAHKVPWMEQGTHAHPLPCGNTELTSKRGSANSLLNEAMLRGTRSQYVPRSRKKGPHKALPRTGAQQGDSLLLPDLANENTGCPVMSEFQINNA